MRFFILFFSALLFSCGSTSNKAKPIVLPAQKSVKKEKIPTWEECQRYQEAGKYEKALSGYQKLLPSFSQKIQISPFIASQNYRKSGGTLSIRKKI